MNAAIELDSSIHLRLLEGIIEGSYISSVSALLRPIEDLSKIHINCPVEEIFGGLSEAALGLT